MGRSFNVSRAGINIPSNQQIASLVYDHLCLVYILRNELKEPQAYTYKNSRQWTILSSTEHHHFYFRVCWPLTSVCQKNMKLCAISRNDVRVVQHFPFYYRNKYVPRWRIHVTMGILFGFLLAIWKGNFYYATLLLL